MKNLMILPYFFLFVTFCWSQESLDELKKECYENNEPLETVLKLYGSANIANSLDKQSFDPNANFSIGFYMFEELPPKDKYKFKCLRKLSISSVELNMGITSLSTADTIKAEFNSMGNISNQRLFGNSILQRNQSDAGAYIDLILRKHPCSSGFIRGYRFGLDAYARVWDSGSSSEPMVAASFRLGIFHEFVEYKDINKVSVLFGIDANYVRLGGDIANSGFTDLRRDILQTSKIRYFGFEPYLEVSIQRTIDMRAHVFMQVGPPEVLGLSGIQLSTLIRFKGGVNLVQKQSQPANNRTP